MSTTTALAMPEPPHRPAAVSDFDGMIRMSQLLAKSSLVPSAYRGKPENVLLATLAGQPFGWDPTMAMRSFHVIEGQPSLKPEIMLALVRRAGHSVTGGTDPNGATITGKRRDTADTMTVTYTIEDARRANLLGKAVWKQYPQSMCWARALSQLCRMLFPDVVLGAGYTPEELGATTNDEAPAVIEATHTSSETPPTGNVDQDGELVIRTGDAKKRILDLYINAGFEDAAAKTYAADVWKKHQMPTAGFVSEADFEPVWKAAQMDTGGLIDGTDELDDAFGLGEVA